MADTAEAKTLSNQSPDTTTEFLPLAEKQTAMKFAAWTADALEEYILSAQKHARTTNEEDTITSLLDDVKWLRTEIAKISDPSDLEKIFTELLSRLEQRDIIPTSHQIIYRAHQLITETRSNVEMILGTEEEDGYVQQYATYLSGEVKLENIGRKSQERTQELEARKVKEGYKIILRKLKEKGLDEQTVKELATSLGIATGFVALRVAANPSEALNPSRILEISTGLLFGAYTIYVALLLSAAEAKVTRGTTALEALSGSLVTYAEFAPETIPVIKEILQKLEEGITKTGDLNADDSLRLLTTLTSKTRNPIVGDNRYKDISDNLYSLREACRQGVSQKTRRFLRVWGGATSAAAAFSGDNPVEGGVFAGVLGATTGTLQEIIRDLDKPWGEDGSMTLDKTPINIALQQIDFIEKETAVRREAGDRLKEKAAIDKNIINSFYQCFRDIFDPYYKALQSNPEAEPPKFFVGQNSKEHGTFDMDKEISFRYNDDLTRQLALLEAIKEKMLSNEAMDDDEKTGVAVNLLDKWIQQVGSLKEMQKTDPSLKTTPKTREEENQHAIDAIAEEIIGNIKSKGQAVYMLKRQAGTGKIDFATANRSSDWEDPEETLNPIHTGIITKLQQESTRDTGNAEKYRKVIEDINRARVSKNLEIIAVAS